MGLLCRRLTALAASVVTRRMGSILLPSFPTPSPQKYAFLNAAVAAKRCTGKRIISYLVEVKKHADSQQLSEVAKYPSKHVQTSCSQKLFAGVQLDPGVKQRVNNSPGGALDTINNNINFTRKTTTRELLNILTA